MGILQQNTTSAVQHFGVRTQAEIDALNADAKINRAVYRDGSIVVRREDGAVLMFTGLTANVSQFAPACNNNLPIAVTASRMITTQDYGVTLECSTTVTLTIPAGLPLGFEFYVLPSGTTSFASSGGTLLNGATSTVTRAAATAANALITIQARIATDSYVITGA